MLFKWLVLAIVAWYIYRAGRNLLLAATGRSEEPLATRQRPHARPRPEDTPPDQDVEDARFVDL